MATVKLIPNDFATVGKEFVVLVSDIKKSILIKSMIEEQDDSDIEPIPLPKVDSDDLEKIVEYLAFNDEPYIEIEKPLKSSNLADVTAKWFAEYILKYNNDQVLKLIPAANYMDIPCLLDLACAYISAKLRCKTPEEIREEFKLPEPKDEEDDELVEEVSNN